MNKKFAAFLTQYGMNVNGNSAYGTVKGYETNVFIRTLDNYFPFRLHISCYTTDEQKRNIEAALRNAAVKYCKTQFTQYGLGVFLNDITSGRLLKRLPALFELIYGILTENGALGSAYCPVCGKELTDTAHKAYQIDGVTVTLEEECVNTINAVITAENQDFSQAPNNYLKGFCGALIGGIVGGGIAAALYFVGFVSAISAIVAVVLGAFLYEKFHGKPNKMMIVIVSCTTLVCMVLSIFVIYIVAAGIAANDAGLSMTAFEAFSYCMTYSEFKRAFYVDLALLVVFTAIGIGVEIFALLNKIKRKSAIR